ncbi:hypothetical protein SNE40_023239 [Patella caerulea]|uniref:Uncharacterized protein n=1 Tax=Patella caerulea TaxID=87958 RepID=A0AAN8G2I2_PATCE
MQLFADALSGKGILSTDNLHDIVKQLSCSIESYNCMYGLVKFAMTHMYWLKRDNMMSMKKCLTNSGELKRNREPSEVTITVKKECFDTVENFIDTKSQKRM